MYVCMHDTSIRSFCFFEDYLFLPTESGCPTERIWPALDRTPLATSGLVDLTQERMKYPHNSLPDIFDEVQLSVEVRACDSVIHSSAN